MRIERCFVILEALLIQAKSPGFDLIDLMSVSISYFAS